jgi:FixJ family two-component response regulator
LSHGWILSKRAVQRKVLGLEVAERPARAVVSVAGLVRGEAVADNIAAAPMERPVIALTGEGRIFMVVGLLAWPAAP